jgi:hypothetical protein
MAETRTTERYVKNKDGTTTTPVGETEQINKQAEPNVVRTIYPRGITGDELADDTLRQFAEARAQRDKP